MSVNDRMSEEQAEKSYNRAVRLEQDFLQYFTSIVDVFLIAVLKGHICL